MMPGAARCGLVLLAAALVPGAASADGLALVGTEIVLESGHGATARRGVEVVGTGLELPGQGALQIRSAALDAESRFGDIWLYQLDGAAGSVCDADGSGDTRAVLFPGRIDAALRYHADPGRFSLSCVSGVQAKCLRWGYRPWAKAPLTGESLAPYYEACVRLARADYCGDDQPTTRDGTTIDVYDKVGVQQPDYSVTGLEFEAGWAPTGAVCVAHARIPEHLDLAELPAGCPRLQPAELGHACTERTAAARGALLFNRSATTPPASAPGSVARRSGS
jgi:hypothetical protein